MILRCFHKDGIQEFANYLAELRSNPVLPVPIELLTNPRLTMPLKVRIDANPPASFSTRMAFATWLHEAAAESNAEIPRNDDGFWAWLSLALFDHVCPVDGRGQRKPGADPRYIVEVGNWQRRYRHLLMGPYEIFFNHRDDPSRALVGLINPLHTPGELSENIGGRLDIVRCPGSMSLATYLCIDSNGRRRKGASGEFANEFGKITKRVQRTFDLPIMHPQDSLKLIYRKKLKRLVNTVIRDNA